MIGFSIFYGFKYNIWKSIEVRQVVRFQEENVCLECIFDPLLEAFDSDVKTYH